MGAMTVLVDNWIILYCILTYLQSGDGLQLDLKFFADVYTCLRIHHCTITAYHPQANGQMKRFTKTVVTPLWHYEVEQEADWDQYFELLTYAYSPQVHR